MSVTPLVSHVEMWPYVASAVVELSHHAVTAVRRVAVTNLKFVGEDVGAGVIVGTGVGAFVGAVGTGVGLFVGEPVGAGVTVGAREVVGAGVGGSMTVKLPAVPLQVSSAPPLSPPTLQDTSPSLLPPQQ